MRKNCNDPRRNIMRSLDASIGARAFHYDWERMRVTGPAEKEQYLSPKIQTTMSEFWNHCEGKTVLSHRLDRYLRASSGSALYATESAVIKLVRADEAERQAQLNTWAEVSQLSHPRLIRVIECGECEVEGVSLIYVVMERSEGDLGGVLPERAL